jgi:hypothetical protein
MLFSRNRSSNGSPTASNRRSTRRRPSAALVVACTAIVLSLGGSAYAASYLITNTNQIAPMVLKQLKGNKGQKGAKGNTGLQGLVGPAGPAGPAGAPGTPGATGPAGPGGPAGPTGPAGATNVTVVRATIGSGTGFHAGYAHCPAGQRATGGGVGLSGGSFSGHYLYTLDTGPTDSSGNFDHTSTGTVPVSWYGSVWIPVNVGPAYVWVICAAP